MWIFVVGIIVNSICIFVCFDLQNHLEKFGTITASFEELSSNIAQIKDNTFFQGEVIAGK